MRYQYFGLVILVITLLACKAQKERRAIDELKESSYIEVDLVDRLDPQRMVIAFGPAYGLSYECIVDKSKNIVIYHFDYEKISLGALIDSIKFEVGVDKVTPSNGCSLD